MKISRDWLSDFVDVSDLRDDELARRMTEIGHAVEAVEAHQGDSIFEVEFTTNRIDAMSHLGLARELGAALGRELRAPGVHRKPSPESRDVTIRIDAPALCDRYTAQIVRGIRVGPSGENLRRRLEAIGLRPINNVVDATNYAMMSIGHPLHAFDLREVQERTIVVRDAAPGEKLRTLDGVERSLQPGTPVIADGRRGVAIGGVMGGANSEIGDDTTEVLLECAHFEPSAIRRTARRLGMKTDASFRFERNVDPNDTILAISVCADLIVAEAGGELGELVDVVARPIRGATVRLSEARLREISDGRIELRWAAELFGRLGFETRAAERGLVVTVPTWRGDVSEEDDLLEEALRFHGYDNIPASLPRVSTGQAAHNPIADLEDETRDLLVAAGLAETMSYGFIHADHNAAFSPEAPLTVMNALTENIASMRLSLGPGLLSAVAWNRSYGTRDGSLFEVGRTYHRAGNSFQERPKAGVVLFGQTGGDWGEARRSWDFFDLKGIVEAVTGRLHVPLSWTPADLPWARSGAAAEGAADGEVVAVAGAVRREVLETFDLKGEILFAEIRLDLLDAGRRGWEMRPVSRFPGVPMVLAMMHAPDLRYEVIVERIRKLEVPFLETVGLWDRFVPPGGEQIKTALGMWYQAPDRSLTQEEVAEIHGRVARTLGETLPVRILG